MDAAAPVTAECTTIRIRLMPSSYEFRTIVPGLETISGAVSRPRHHHREGYATVVLAGSFTEVSFAGRMYAEPGDVLLHGPFDCHLDIGRSRGSLQILRLHWRSAGIEGQFRVRDPDVLARLAEVDPGLAALQLHDELRPYPRRVRCWIDELAAALGVASGFLLQQWADGRGVRADAVSRAFRREFGVSAQRFRLESRTRLAWREVVGSTHALTDIALQTGFSDLAHMTRSMHVLTGRPPSAWRRTARKPESSTQVRSSVRSGRMTHSHALWRK
jgi:AraC-like DNA-binding protein